MQEYRGVRDDRVVVALLLGSSLFSSIANMVVVGLGGHSRVGRL